MGSQAASADERRLNKLFRSLDPPRQETLLSFAEFLAERSATGRSQSEREANAEAARARCAVPAEPLFEPRPAQESVVSGIRRLRRTYPMLDGAAMLHEASSLMAAHVLHGRAAADIIDELEVLFAERFDAHRRRRDRVEPDRSEPDPAGLNPAGRDGST